MQFIPVVMTIHCICLSLFDALIHLDPLRKYTFLETPLIVAAARSVSAYFSPRYFSDLLTESSRQGGRH